MEATPVSPHLLAGTLAMLLRHCLTGCPHTGLQVADLLERLADVPELDLDMRVSCEQMSQQLYRQAGC